MEHLQNEKSRDHCTVGRRLLQSDEHLLQKANEIKQELERELERERREVLQLRKYNKQLEGQFNSQMELITELKKRYLDLSGKVRV
jgi:uncharacterized membrane-anchored protein YhcB (DUF1043 family)